MPCYTPLTAYQLDKLNPKTGKAIIKVCPADAVNFIPPLKSTPIKLACGQCRDCRLNRSRFWGLRIMHETKSHEHNQFLTLTYNDNHLPEHNSLKPDDLTRFFKRLRKHYSIRHYSCGEYGDKTERPHYHSIVFGLNIEDKKHHTTTKTGHNLYTSEILQSFWTQKDKTGNKTPIGHVYIGDVTMESASYVARYILKKTTGKHAYKRYMDIDKETGELLKEILPEFTRMSNRPGIGRDFYNKYHRDMYQPGTDGKIILLGGTELTTPRYYDNIYEQENPIHMKQIKEERKTKAIEESLKLDTPTSAMRQKVSLAKTKQLIRPLE